MKVKELVEILSKLDNQEFSVAFSYREYLKPLEYVTDITAELVVIVLEPANH